MTSACPQANHNTVYYIISYISDLIPIYRVHNQQCYTGKYVHTIFIQCYTLHAFTTENTTSHLSFYVLVLNDLLTSWYACNTKIMKWHNRDLILYQFLLLHWWFISKNGMSCLKFVLLEEKLVKWMTNYDCRTWVQLFCVIYWAYRYIGRYSCEGTIKFLLGFS